MNQPAQPVTPAPRASRLGRVRQWLAVAVSAIIIAVIFYSIDLGEFSAVFAGLNWWWFALGMLAFLPSYHLLAGRLRYLMGSGMGYGEALRSILMASSLNTILPSKGGDLVKAVFIRRQTGLALETCVSAVILERVTDVAALVGLMVLGLAFVSGASELLPGAWVGAGLIVLGVAFYFFLHFSPLPAGIVEWLARPIPKIGGFLETSIAFVRSQVRSGRIAGVFAYSLVSWTVHLLQFLCFFLALGYEGPFLSVLAFVPAAIFIGLVPITVAGFGTRDAAMILLFAPWASAEMMAGAALLSHLRYLVPGLVGVFFFRGLAGED